MAGATFTRHRRFAVRRDVVVHAETNSGQDGLMYELSREGCRVCGVETRDFGGESDVTIALGKENLPGRIHWNGGTSMVIKFRDRLSIERLEGLLSDSCPPADVGIAYA